MFLLKNTRKNTTNRQQQNYKKAATEKDQINRLLTLNDHNYKFKET
jgi:hypothetical protein